MELMCTLNILEDFWLGITSTQVTLANSMFRLLVAMLIGCVIGWERKRKGQVAGLRTFTLISMGACLAMLLSIYVPQEYMGLKNGDPGRIAAQVVTGVGFLGGGAMIQQKGSIRGLTTAAGIWVVATLGMAVGVGMYGAAVIATVLVMITLISLEHWEHKVRIGQESRVVNVRVGEVVHDVAEYRKVFKANKMHLSTFYIEVDYERNQSEISFIVLSRRGADYLSMFDALKCIAPVEAITLSSQVDI
ncbi:MAG: MgtC/SapB family protein [Prevotella sp.]|nr:MgtC/SapB family protein [Prevotella sp.]MCM1074644.1 MgtC/SapB family protein [Ruminococcus sp.]